MDPQTLVVRGSLSAMAGFLVRLGARMLFLMLAARLYGVALFGAFSLATAAAEFAVAIAGLGNKRLIFKWLDERRAERPPGHVLVDAALLVIAAGATLAGAIMAAALLLPGLFLDGAAGRALLLVAPMIIGQALLDLLLAATRWHHSMRYEVVARSLVEPYAAALVTFGAYFAGVTSSGLVLGYWAGTLAALAYAVMGTRRVFGALSLRRYQADLQRLAALLRQSALPTLSDAVNAFFTRLDLYLVGALMGTSAAGIYAMARQIRIPVRQVRQSFDGMLTPLISRTLAKDGPLEAARAAASAVRLILALQLALVVLLVALGKPLLGWFGPGFVAGYWAMVVLAIAESIQGAFGVSDLLLLYRRPMVTVRITAISIIVNMVAAMLLIRPLGALGAAFAVLIANVAGAAIRRGELRAGTGFAPSPGYHAGPFLACLAGGAAALLMVAGATPLAGATANVIACAIGIAAYSMLLLGWMSVSGERLRLSHFSS